MHTLDYEIDCTTCGCPDTEVEREPRAGAWFADGIARCNDCGQQFSFRAPKEHEEKEQQTTVSFQAIRCPSCRSTDVPVTHSALPVRYHRCRQCQTTFKSVEKRT
jgi:uncharacterized protein with PIN domain